MSDNLDDLELELRKLPGVRAAGFDEGDDVLLVQLHVSEAPRSDVALPIAASRIASRYSERPVAVEVVRWREPAPVPTSAPAIPVPQPSLEAEEIPEEDEEEASTRPRLLAVLSFPDTDELEVHLILAGRRTIGRAAASRGLVGAVEATLEAVRALGAEIDSTPRWARELDSYAEGTALVAVALGAEETDSLFGLAGGASPIDAAARATLDAINRQLARAL